MYKKRLVMTIAGVAGCTSLIITSFALRNAISQIVPMQYGDLFRMDAQIFYRDSVSDEILTEETNRILDLPEVTRIARAGYIITEAKNNGKTHSVQVVIPENMDDFQSQVILRDSIDGHKLSISDDGVIISEKIAKLLNKKIGDDLTVFSTDGIEYNMIVNGIAENYVFHYIYMSRAYGEKIFGEKTRMNMLLVDAVSGFSEENLSSELNQNNYLTQITFVSESEKAYQKITDSLNIIVAIMAVSAGLLNLVVLLNLNNINISERRKELATLKVLGFSKREVSQYIKREVRILVAFGAILGSVIGYFLSKLVISTCEMDTLMYYNHFEIKFCLYSIVITILFSIIADILASKTINKIDMVESLKRIS